ncbi:MAG: HNH endonuclease [Methylophagaceae bacterium]
MCEYCDIKLPMIEQLVVFHVDSNRQNINVSNLKTVCLNCNFELSKTGWVQGDLLEDH